MNAGDGDEMDKTDKDNWRQMSANRSAHDKENQGKSNGQEWLGATRIYPFRKVSPCDGKKDTHDGRNSGCQAAGIAKREQ